MKIILYLSIIHYFLAAEIKKDHSILLIKLSKLIGLTQLLEASSRTQDDKKEPGSNKYSNEQTTDKQIE